MPPRLNLIGERYGRLTVIDFAYIKNGNSYWKCICDCNTIITVRANSLRVGDTVSCGCKKLDTISNGITLCKKCHNEFHGKYGKKNNTKEQLYLFINSFKGVNVC